MEDHVLVKAAMSFDLSGKTEEDCVLFMESIRWPKGRIQSPFADAYRVYVVRSRRVHYKYVCPVSKRYFDVKTGTFMQSSKIKIYQWIFIIQNIGVLSSYKMAKALGITQKTAWINMSKIEAME